MFLTLCLIILLSLLLLISIWFSLNFSYWSKYKNIPSITGRILSDNIFNVVLMKNNFYGRLKEIYADSKFVNEAVVGVYGAYKPSLLIRDPTLIKDILIKDFDCFHDRFVKPSSIYDPTGHSMLFFAPYLKWRKMRKTFSHTFSFGRLKLYAPAIKEVGERLERRLNSKPTQYTEDIWNLCTRYIIDALASFIGVTSDSLNNSQGLFQNAVMKLGHYDLGRAFNILIIFFIPTLSDFFRARVAPKHLEGILTTYFKNALAEREQLPGTRNDIIDICLKCLKDFKGTDAERETLKDDLVAQSMAFVTAGVETCMATTTYVLFELARNEDIQERLRHDIITVFKQTSDDDLWERLNKLEYMECVISECLRVYPPLQFIERVYYKTADREFSLQPHYDYQLPDGMPIYISIAGLNADPKYWQNPTKYDPERFRGDNKNKANSVPFLPFGDGPRNCIGGRLGMMMVKFHLAYFLRNHYVRCCDRTIKSIKFNPMSGTLKPVGGIHLEIRRDDLCAKACKN